MNNDKYVIIPPSFLSRSQFNDYVRKYHGDKYVKSFTCWNQLLAFMFGQLANRESLRNLIVALEAHRGKCHFLGMRTYITRSNLAKANESRDYRIFEDFAYHMIDGQGGKESPTSSNLKATSTLSTRPPSTCASACSSGQGSEPRIGKSKSTRCTM